MQSQGMQHNPGCKTIEGELGSALNKAGAISNENAGEFSKVCPGDPPLISTCNLQSGILLATSSSAVHA